MTTKSNISIKKAISDKCCWFVRLDCRSCIDFRRMECQKCTMQCTLQMEFSASEKWIASKKDLRVRSISFFDLQYRNCSPNMPARNCQLFCGWGKVGICRGTKVYFLSWWERCLTLQLHHIYSPMLRPYTQFKPYSRPWDGPIGVCTMQHLDAAGLLVLWFV